MQFRRTFLFSCLFGAGLLPACRVEEKPPVAAVPSPETHSDSPREEEGIGRVDVLPLPRNSRTPGAKDEDSASPAAERAWGRADLDPDNDNVVAPPEPVPGCAQLLSEHGVEFSPARLPLAQVVREVPTCGAHDAVTVHETPSGMSLSPPAVMTCQLALALVGLDALIQELAQKHLFEQIRTLHQGGTYSCRKMARFDLVSEHSYGNAIDVRSFTTESGKKISVISHYGPLDGSPESLSKMAIFLRELASAAYDRDLVSVSLSPYWDALHRDHFHFDMARYRVDGTRP